MIFLVRKNLPFIILLFVTWILVHALKLKSILLPIIRYQFVKLTIHLLSTYSFYDLSLHNSLSQTWTWLEDVYLASFGPLRDSHPPLHHYKLCFRANKAWIQNPNHSYTVSFCLLWWAQKFPILQHNCRDFPHCVIKHWYNIQPRMLWWRYKINMGFWKCVTKPVLPDVTLIYTLCLMSNITIIHV